MSNNRTEEGIKNSVDALLSAVMRKDEEDAGTAAIILLGGVLMDLRTIANAVEKLAEANPDPTKPLSLRDLTPEERDTIEALRRGDIEWVPVKGRQTEG